jgi:hypothetical protein
VAKEHKNLDALPPKASRRFEEKYPDLSRWLNGSVWELEPKVDFKVTTETFYQSFREYLRRTGTKAEIGQRGKNVWVRASSRSSSGRTPARASRTAKRPQKKRR